MNIHTKHTNAQDDGGWRLPVAGCRLRRRRRRLLRRGALVAQLALLLAWHMAPPASAQNITQTLTLQPGWNSVYLEVTPTNPALSAVFGSVPIDSVWTFAARSSAIDFIQNPSEPVWNRDSWLLYVPTNRPESFQNNLFTLQANVGYLVNLSNAVPVTLNVTGRPSLRRAAWVPDAYNFRGFPIDPANRPTFQSFFAPSPAHYSAGALQRIYQLNNSGQWGLVNPGDLMSSGMAYWVFTKGASDYVAPLTVSVEIGDGLDFSKDANELSLVLQNRTSVSQTAFITDTAAPAPNPLSYFKLSPSDGVQWFNLPSPLVRTNPGSASQTLRTSVRRQDFDAEFYQTVLAISDGAGTRLLVPVAAGKTLATGAQGSGLAGFKGAAQSHGLLSAPDEAKTHAGLWVGNAIINAVSEPHSGTLVTNASRGYTLTLVTNDNFSVTTNYVPNSVTRTNVSLATTPVKNEFGLRVLLHVNTNGETSLLKEVIQMWQDGTYTNDSQGALVPAVPGHYVLVTDDARIAQFQGATLRDGVPVGRRLSTVNFDFASGSANNFLSLSGAFAVGSVVSGGITLAPDFPTNPFMHKYHPDHDNKNANGDTKIESYQVTRTFSLEFAPPPTNAPPDYGYNRIDGVYRETLSGLHRSDIAVSGTFTLTRMAVTGVLNQ